MKHTLFDRITVIASLSLVFSLFGVLGIRDTFDTLDEQREATESVSEASGYCYVLSWYNDLRKLLASIPVSCKAQCVGTFEEEVSDEMNCLLYATIPIGRYYITAYNHEETGSKMTASGKTCHEGTITTCAADVWGGYFRFGDIIEVDGRLFVVEDTGSAVKRRHIDLYFASYKAMARYGSNYQTIYRVEFPFGKPKYD